MCFALSTSFERFSERRPRNPSVCGRDLVLSTTPITNLCVPFVRALAKLIVLEVKTSVLSEVLS